MPCHPRNTGVRGHDLTRIIRKAEPVPTRVAAGEPQEAALPHHEVLPPRPPTGSFARDARPRGATTMNIASGCRDHRPA